MDSETAPYFIMAMLAAGIATGLPFAFVLGAVSVISTMLFWGTDALAQMAFQSFRVVEDFVLIAVPLFVFMAMILFKSRVAEDMFDMIYKWSGSLRGGLAIGTQLICAVMAACTGIAGGTETAMGLIALPSMRKYKYQDRITIGTVLSGGTLGQLVPPSVLMVVYGVVTNVSIGKMFAGGFAAGLILISIYVIYIAIRCLLNRNLCPALPPEERVGWKEKFAALNHVILPVLLIILVLGSIFAGIATPTEAAAVGVVGALLSTLVKGRLSRAIVIEAGMTTLQVTSLVGWIMISAAAFTNIFIIAGGKEFMENILSILPGGRWGILICSQIIILLLGMILDNAAIVLICGPLFSPIMVGLGFNEVWFALLFMIQMQIAYISPPFGMSLFYLYSVAPDDIKMTDMYRAAYPFMMCQLVALSIMIIFPETIMWLPNLVIK